MILYSDAALADLARLEEAAPGAELVIDQVVMLLDDHPLIGRSVESGLRELVISRGKTGYVALYDHIAATGTIIVFAVRHQREVGYDEGEA